MTNKEVRRKTFKALQALTVAQLQRDAEALGLVGIRGLRKATLIQAIARRIGHGS